MSNYLELSTTTLLNIKNGSKANVTLKSFGAATTPSENITKGTISLTECLDIANRVKTFMDTNGRAPNYATTSLGKMRPETLVYMYSQILDSYNKNRVLPNNISISPWTNGTILLGNTSYGYVEKEFYGNLSSNITIVIIIGVHPQENGIHTAIGNALSNKSDTLRKRYVIYKIHVTKAANDYSKGRMNGQLLGQQFVVPDVSSENPILVTDIHENHYKDSGYDYCRFLYPISNTSITTTYANEIISKMPFLVIYSPPNPTSTQYVTVPITNQGIPTIIYETYINDSSAKKTSDANAFIGALDLLTSNQKINASNKSSNQTLTFSVNGGSYRAPQTISITSVNDSEIYYTLDGSIPAKSSKRYTGSIKISSSKTLIVTAWDSSNNQLGSYTQQYKIYHLVNYTQTIMKPLKKVWKKVKSKKVNGKWRYTYKKVWEYKKVKKTVQKWVLT